MLCLLLSMNELIIDRCKELSWKLEISENYEFITLIFYTYNYFWGFGVFSICSEDETANCTFYLCALDFVKLGTSLLFLKCFLYCSFKLTYKIVGYFAFAPFFDFTEGVDWFWSFFSYTNISWIAFWISVRKSILFNDIFGLSILGFLNLQFSMIKNLLLSSLRYWMFGKAITYS